MIVAAFPSPRLVLSFRLALFYAAVFLVVGVATFMALGVLVLSPEGRVAFRR